MKKPNTAFLSQAAMIAAVYVVLTYVFAPFSPAAVPGLFIGCLIGNILGGAILPDIVFGSIATLIGAFGTYLLRNQLPVLAPLPPILANTVIVPFILHFGYGVALPIPFLMLTIGIGEILSCGVLGIILYIALKKYKNIIFVPVS